MVSKFFLAVTITGLLVAAGGPNNQRTKSIDQLLVAVRWADRHSARDAYRELFPAVGKDGLPALERHPDTSIAIQAAWETAIGSLTDADRKNRVRHPNSLAASRFVGFLEGRTRKTAPRWWVEFVQNDPNLITPDSNPGSSVDNAVVLKRPTITTVNGSYVLSIGDASVIVPSGIPGLDITDEDDENRPERRQNCSKTCDDNSANDEEFDDYKPHSRVSAVFTDSHCFLTAYGPIPHSDSIGCIDRMTGELIWLSDVCGCADGVGSSSGWYESWVTTVADDDAVIVYGAATKGFYVQGFDPVSGKTLFRFSTAFSSL